MKMASLLSDSARCEAGEQSLAANYAAGVFRRHNASIFCVRQRSGLDDMLSAVVFKCLTPFNG